MGVEIRGKGEPLPIAGRWYMPMEPLGVEDTAPDRVAKDAMAVIMAAPQEAEVARRELEKALEERNELQVRLDAALEGLGLWADAGAEVIARRVERLRLSAE